MYFKKYKFLYERKFKIKSSAMKIIIPKANKTLNFKYFYYLLKNIKYFSETHTRLWISVFPKFGYYVNLSIPYRLSQKEPLLTKKEINKQKYYFSLTGKRKEQILEQLHLKQTDTVYAYSIKEDKLDTYLIKDLEMIAYNPIEIIEGKIEEKYFDVGLLLSYSEEVDTSYKGKEYDYASIEDGNIFQTGKIKRIESVKIKNIDIPFPINYSLLDKYAYYEYPISLHIDNTYKGKINIKTSLL